MTGKLASRVRGLGEAEFQAAYGTEERCRTAVEELRWPEGFVCPVCGGRQGTRLSTRPKIQCTSCRHQASSTAGTIFASTKPPLIPTAPVADRSGPLAAGDRGEPVGRRHEPVPGLAAGRDDRVVVGPDPQAELVLAQVLPDV